MLEALVPNATVTGGPWYTDNEFDTEFIKLLKQACLKFIQNEVRLLFHLPVNNIEGVARAFRKARTTPGCCILYRTSRCIRRPAPCGNFSSKVE